MPSLISLADGSKFRGRRKEALGSANLNQKAMVTPRGIVRGFRPVPDVANQTLKLEVDPLLGDSVAQVTCVDTADAADGYPLTYRETADITLDLSGEAGTTVYVGLTSEYNPASSAAVTPRWYAYSQAEIDNGTADEALIFCAADVPGSAIPLVAADIDESERDEPWMWVSARGSSDIPLVTPGSDDEFKLWTYESLNGSSAVVLDTTNKKRGNASLLLDVNDAGAVTNEFGPGEVFNVVPGELLFVKFWYRTSAAVNFSTNPTFVAEFYAAGTSLGTETISISTSPQTTFTLVEDQLIVPASSRQVRFYYNVQTNGVTDFYVDSLQVYLRRQDSDVGGWLENTERGLGKYVGASAMFLRHPEDDSSDPPFIWTRPSATELQLDKAGNATGTSDILLGRSSGHKFDVGINTGASPLSALHVRGRNTSGSSVLTVLTVERTVDIASPSAGIGAEIDINVETGSGNLTTGRIVNQVTTVTTSSEESNLRWSIQDGGTLTEKMRLDSTGLGLGVGAGTIDTSLHMASTTEDTNKLRIELNNTVIANGHVYGTIEFEGQDASTNASGIRGSIRGEAEDAAGGLALVFATATDSVAAPPTDRVKITNMGFVVVADDFTVFDTTDNTNYGFDIGSDSLRMLVQANNQNNANVLALYNSNTTGKDSINEIRFYREDAGQSPTLNRIGTLRVLHEGSSSDYLGQFDLELNSGSTATGLTRYLSISSAGYSSFGDVGGAASGSASGLRLTGNSNSNAAVTLTFEDTQTSHTGSELLGSIDFYTNHTGDAGVAARVRATTQGGSDGEGVLHFYTRPGPAGSITRRFSILDTGDVNVVDGLVISSATTLLTNSSVGLEINSTSRALLVSQMSTTQKNALTAVNGMIVYDTTLNKFQGYENGTWTSFI